MKILHHARIYTIDRANPLASALVVDRGEVTAVGGDELLADYGRATKQDLGGRTVLPGLTDAHLHLHYYALGLQKVDCETEMMDECLRRVSARAASTSAGDWVLGHGWNQNVWGGWPHLRDLDSVVPDHPVYLTAKSLHAAWANSAALRLAGITSATPDPKDGKIQRDERGEPTGVLLESAMALVGDLVPEPGLTGLADAMEKAQSTLWQMGITGVHDFDRRESFMALQYLHAAGRLKLRVTKNLPVDLLNQAFELGLRTGFG